MIYHNVDKKDRMQQALSEYTNLEKEQPWIHMVIVDSFNILKSWEKVKSKQVREYNTNKCFIYKN